MALINRRAYADMMQNSTIDIAVSPSQTVIGELLTHLRRGDVVAVHSLRRGAAEALEGWYVATATRPSWWDGESRTFAGQPGAGGGRGARRGPFSRSPHAPPRPDDRGR